MPEETPKVPVETTTTPPDPNAPLLDALRKEVAVGNWKAVGTFLAEHVRRLLGGEARTDCQGSDGGAMTRRADG